LKQRGKGDPKKREKSRKRPGGVKERRAEREWRTKIKEFYRLQVAWNPGGEPGDLGAAIDNKKRGGKGLPIKEPKRKKQCAAYSRG